MLLKCSFQFTVKEQPVTSEERRKKYIYYYLKTHDWKCSTNKTGFCAVYPFKTRHNKKSRGNFIFIKMFHDNLYWHLILSLSAAAFFVLRLLSFCLGLVFIYFNINVSFLLHISLFMWNAMCVWQITEQTVWKHS